MDDVLEVGWMYCDDWNSINCRTMWSTRDIYNIEPGEIDVYGRSERAIFRLATSPIGQTIYNRETVLVSSTLRFKPSHEHLGYYVCYFIPLWGEDQDAFGPDVRQIRYAVTLPVNVTRRYGYIGDAASVNFTLNDVPDLSDTTIRVELSSNDTNESYAIELHPLQTYATSEWSRISKNFDALGKVTYSLTIFNLNSSAKATAVMLRNKLTQIGSAETGVIPHPRPNILTEMILTLFTAVFSILMYVYFREHAKASPRCVGGSCTLLVCLLTILVCDKFNIL